MTASGDPRRLAWAFLTFAAWVAATLFSMNWAGDGKKRPLVETISHGLGWNIVIAIAVLVIATLAFRWRDLGFVKPRLDGLLRIFWFPLLYLVIFVGIALFLGLPPLATLLFVGLNTLLVGLSEEWMFRGILFRALQTRFTIWPAIILTCVLFGSVHVLNVFVTGELGAAALQALTASLSGLVFMAMLIRTGSLWVPVIYHALWDYCTFMISAGSDASQPDPIAAGGLMYLVPLALVLPNFLYALFLLRKVGQGTLSAPA